MQADYEELFPILMEQEEISVLINPFCFSLSEQGQRAVRGTGSKCEDQPGTFIIAATLLCVVR